MNDDQFSLVIMSFSCMPTANGIYGLKMKKMGFIRIPFHSQLFDGVLLTGAGINDLDVVLLIVVMTASPPPVIPGYGKIGPSFLEPLLLLIKRDLRNVTSLLWLLLPPE